MKPSLTMDVARVVRGILAIRGIQQTEFASTIGESTSSVSRWLKGGTFNSDTLEEMATGLGMSADELVRLAVLSRSVDDGELSALLKSRARKRDGSGNPGTGHVETGS